MKVNKKKRFWIPDKPKQWQTTEDNNFYHTRAWRGLRKQFIQEHPICQQCETKGITKPAKVVDHILSIRKGGQELDKSNLQSLCESCHNSKSSIESK